MLAPGADRERRDQIGGALVADVSETIILQSRKHSIDSAMIRSVLRHESAAIERRTLTLLPGDQPGLGADAAEACQVLLQGDTASIGPGQMQLRRAQELEQLGYVMPRGNDLERVQALLGRESSVEYVTGMLHYVSDQLHTLSGFNGLSYENQQRLTLLGYNWGWTQEFQDKLARLGFEKFISEYGYDNQTLDEYLRWQASKQ